MPFVRTPHAGYERRRVPSGLLEAAVERPEQVVELFAEMQDETREKVVVLHLDGALRILSYEIVAMGSPGRVTVDPAAIFRGALYAGAGSLIVVRNYLRDTPRPTSEDQVVARSLQAMGRVHTVPLQDYILVGYDGFYSFEREGRLGVERFEPQRD